MSPQAAANPHDLPRPHDVVRPCVPAGCTTCVRLWPATHRHTHWRPHLSQQAAEVPRDDRQCAANASKAVATDVPAAAAAAPGGRFRKLRAGDRHVCMVAVVVKRQRQLRRRRGQSTCLLYTSPSPRDAHES
eukprot:365404-Chlamydomonas_euryale.AAC.1